MCKLISYIAPGAPATRCPARGDEPVLRAEVGFTPNWYRQHLDIDFGSRWHVDPGYRRACWRRMRHELTNRFPPGTGIGGSNRAGTDVDFLTGTHGACTVAAIYGVPIVYADDNWPNCEHVYLSDDEVDDLRPPDLEHNAFFRTFMDQVEWIAREEGRVEGYINWQGVLNNAQRLRGTQLFLDLVERPERARHLFECVTTTMIEAASKLHDRQRQSGVAVAFFTVSNCLVNMISPGQYADLLLPFDRRMAEVFGLIGVHNCAWRADPYFESYAQVPNLGYIDMGLDSNLTRARELFPKARRALMYTPMDLADKPIEEIRKDLQRIASEYAPCDVVFADIDAGTPDSRVEEVLAWCAQIATVHAFSP